MNSRQLRTDRAFDSQLTVMRLAPDDAEREKLWQMFLAGYELGRSQNLQGSGHWQPGIRSWREVITAIMPRGE